ncbi:hypothetical protein [Streptacidiphilus melanogenes]|uniref:hypothetical protein n=1 Tax=Streptacidiphilus melanogenes TaxID=411235 RepID=UPI0005A9CDAA|nr:hypothetical protein [Streptacidiphilus melanogenes]
MAWFTELASDPSVAPETRLAAVVQRARCAPDRIALDVVPTAIELLSELAQVHVPASAWADLPRKKTPKSKANAVPPHILAAFEDLKGHGRVHSPTTDLLHTFHQALAHRVHPRTALLAAQVRDPDPGARLDALRMSGDLMRAWRGDHTSLITLVALASLGDPAALPVVHDTLTTAVGIAQWGIACSALETLRAFGPAAAPALAEIRALTGSTDAHVRPAAVAALWAVGRDHEEIMPLLLDLLDDTITFRISDATEVLGQIGAPAAAALPRLRSLLTHEYEWVRVPCAVACLARMGTAARPALPLLRSQLALPRRGGRFSNISNDEDLQAITQKIIRGLT